MSYHYDMKKSKPKSYALRIEAHLVEPLQKLKKQNRRSLNAEINEALEKWIASATKPAAKKKQTVTAATPESAAPKAAAAKRPSKPEPEPASVAPTRSDPASNGEAG